MAKKRYHVVRKQQADMKALLRGLVAAYLLYFAWKLGFSDSPDLPPAARFLAGGLFAVGAAAFGCFTWRQYRAALSEAELTPEEMAELKRERNGGDGV